MKANLAQQYTDLKISNNIDNKENVNNKEQEVKRNKLNKEDYSESIKLKDLTDKDANNSNTKSFNLEQIKQQKEEEEKILNIFKNLEKKTINVLEVKKYGNAIPIGAFCNALTFIVFGIYKARILPDEFANIWTLMALFGGLGQITAGILELMKGREFPSFFYLIYGIYCFSHYILRIFTDRFGKYDLCIYYIVCLLLSTPIVIYSIKINLIYLLQSIFTSLYFLSNAIGEGIDEYILIEQVAGSFQIISGVFSFIIFLSQVINALHSNFYIRTFPFDVNNQIDFIRQIRSKEHSN